MNPKLMIWHWLIHWEYNNWMPQSTDSVSPSQLTSNLPYYLPWRNQTDFHLSACQTDFHFSACMDLCNSMILLSFLAINSSCFGSRAVFISFVSDGFNLCFFVPLSSLYKGYVFPDQKSLPATFFWNQGWLQNVQELKVYFKSTLNSRLTPWVAFKIKVDFKIRQKPHFKPTLIMHKEGLETKEIGYQPKGRIFFMWDQHLQLNPWLN